MAQGQSELKVEDEDKVPLLAKSNLSPSQTPRNYSTITPYSLMIVIILIIFLWSAKSSAPLAPPPLPPPLPPAPPPPAISPPVETIQEVVANLSRITNQSHVILSSTGIEVGNPSSSSQEEKELPLSWFPFFKARLSRPPSSPMWNTSVPNSLVPSFVSRNIGGCRGTLDACVTLKCRTECVHRYDKLPPMQSLKDEAAEVLSSGMLRDLSDYVDVFPYEHFRDRRPNCAGAWQECIRPGAIVFEQNINHLTNEFGDMFPRGFILITTQADADPSSRSFMLNHPNLIRWFAANWPNRDSHPKLERLPLGLCYPVSDPNVFNDYGDVRSMLGFLDQARSRPTRSNQTNITRLVSGWPSFEKLLVLNFRGSHSSRAAIRTYFCAEQYRSWVSCIDPPVHSNTDKINLHATLAEFKFAISPRGNGLDTYRTYEMIWSGVVPIVLSSALDLVYRQLPVLIVESWEQVTEEFLIVKWYTHFRFGNRFNFDILFKPFWIERLIDARRSAFGDNITEFSDTTPGYSCCRA